MEDAPNPGPLFDLSVAFWRSGALFAGIELKLFDTFAGDNMSPSDVADQLDLPLRTVELLLEALAALDLLVVDDCGNFRNTDMSNTYLCADSPAYLGDTIRFNARAWNAWGGLADAIRADRPGVPPETFLGGDRAATHEFVLAMHHRAQGVAQCMMNLIDLDDVHTLLDVGGGPATYARLLAEQYPELHVTVLDLQPIIEVAAELVADSAARERIDLQPGNMFEDDFGQNLDAVLFSGVLHRAEGDGIVALLRKATEALKPQGQVFISDVFSGGDDQGPVVPELFSLQMMLIADQGRSLKLGEIDEQCKSAGLKLQQTVPYPAPLPHTLCVAVKL